MTFNRRWMRNFRIPTSFSRVDRDIAAELRFHLESRIEDLVEAGHSPDQARAIAAQEFGDVRESQSELALVDRRSIARSRRRDLFDSLRHDIWYAVRGIRRQPRFAAMSILVLSLAIGANGTVFSLIDRLLLQPPPGVVHPESLRRLYVNFPNSRGAVNGRAVNQIFSYPEFRAIREALSGVGRAAAYGTWDSTEVISRGDTVYANQGYATAEFLPMLGLRPTAGRFFVESEDDVIAPRNVAVITPRLARRLFFDRDPIGRTMVAHGRRYTVIGVLPDRFQGVDVSAVDFWTPFSTRRPVDDPDRQRWYTRQEVYIPVLVRLDSALSDRALSARLTGPFRRAWTTKLAAYQDRTILAGPIISARGPMRRGQEVSIATRLAVVAVLVLLIACANVANLLLLRIARRRREIAVRLSLGSSRGRLAQQFLAESTVLAVFAGAAAIAISIWLGGLLRASLLPRVHWVGPPVSWRTLVVCAFATGAAAFLAGFAPALTAVRQDVVGSLRVGDLMMARSSPLRGALLAAQVALSLVLISGAGLFLSSLRKVGQVDLGFDTRHLVLGSVYFEDRKRHPEIGPAFAAVADRARRLPGVRNAAVATGAPLQSWMGGIKLFVPGRDSAVSGAEVAYNGVTPGYFATTGTRILVGRALDSADVRGSPPVIVVSRSLATSIWHGENPLGKCVYVDSHTGPCYTVVGVAADVHALRIIEDTQMNFYLPLGQSPFPTGDAIVIRSESVDADAIASTIRTELRQALPGARVMVRTALDLLAPQLRPWQLGAQLFGVMGALSLVVAMIGLYSVIAFGMQQRSREIGVRIALGAQRHDLMRLVVQQAMVPIGVGLVAGTLVALGAGRFVASLLYGVSPRDPVVLAGAALMLMLGAVAAGVEPLRRAARVDPARMLRAE